MEKPKHFCIASIGNPLLDTRITNLSSSLRHDGFTVSVIGFDFYLNTGDQLDDHQKVFSLNRNSPSVLFYIKFVFILFRELLKIRSDVFIAEDIQTLPIVTIIAKIRNAKVIYNSREIYAFIGGLRNKPFIQNIVTKVERFFIKKVDLVLTTGDMDSEFLKKLYSIRNVVTVRNIPLYQKHAFVVDFRKKYNIDANKLILLYQGIIVEGRGIALTIEAMKDLPGAFFIVLGDGPQKSNYEKLAAQFGVSDRVVFAGAFKQNELFNYTAGADVGLTLIENISISYYHALPNKLFEYIMAELPVLSSNLPQMKKIVEQYKVGEAINIDGINEIVSTLKVWCSDKNRLDQYRKNCETASKVLNWEEEYKVFKQGVAYHIESLFPSE
jgi:glycosyltransferase involved in cell wall biosynthesis